MVKGLANSDDFPSGAWPENAAARQRQQSASLDPSMVCMSVTEDGPRISFAAYNEEANVIILEECYADGFEVQNVIERVLAVIRPTLLLLSTKICHNEYLINSLTKPPVFARLVMDEEQGDEHLGDDEGGGGGRETTAQQVTAESAGGAPGNGEPSSIPYKALKTSSFDLRTCHALILQRLRVRSLMNGGGRVIHSQQQRHHQESTQDQRNFLLSTDNFRSIPLSVYHALATLVDFESKLQVQALGSLLSFLGNTIFEYSEEGPEGDDLIVVSDVVRARSSMYMTISPETFSALNIFSTEHHPLSAAKGHGNAKEGFSLFSLLDRTKSRSGRERLKEWMLKPLVDCQAIEQRQNGVEVFLLQEMVEARVALTKLIASVAFVNKILVRIEKCSAKPHDFIALVRSLDSGERIFHVLQHQVLWTLQQLPAASAAVKEGDSDTVALVSPAESQLVSSIAFVESLLQQGNTALFQDLSAHLRAAIDLEATASWHSVLIPAGYDEELDDFKNRYAALAETLKAIGEEESQRYPQLRNLMDVIFLPQIGFHIRLQDDEKWTGDGIRPEDFDFVFTQGGHTYFKSPQTRELDESIGDLDLEIKNKEALILAGLEDHIIDHDVDLRRAFNAISNLDCILAFASCALELGYKRPTMVDSCESCIEIRSGRHPLQEVLLESNYVPNDTSIDVATRLNVLTGPNYSGKSCYARQVGVLVYMAHIGCFLPCDEARISIFRQLFARFSSIETCAVPQSSFQLDISRMGAILRRAGPSSLVLIDEFGKGTSPASGIALLAAALKQLAAANATVVCTTHFLEIFSMKLIKNGEDSVKATQMAVQIPESNAQVAFPLFRLQEGVASSSAGLVCAKIAGLKSAILERAREIVEAARHGRQVRPLTEILRDSLGLSLAGKNAVVHLIRTDWNSADAKDMDVLVNLVVRM